MRGGCPFSRSTLALGMEPTVGVVQPFVVICHISPDEKQATSPPPRPCTYIHALVCIYCKVKKVMRRKDWGDKEEEQSRLMGSSPHAPVGPTVHRGPQDADVP